MTTNQGLQTTTSADGTTLAYEAFGEGPAIALVGGATSDRTAGVELAQALAGHGFTGITYDRRGRGDSGDNPAYAVERGGRGPRRGPRHAAGPGVRVRHVVRWCARAATTPRVADALPHGTAKELDGGFHEAPAAAIAETLADFFGAR